MAVIAPAWRPALVGFPAVAGDANQFLVGHESLISYGGSVQAFSEIGNSSYEPTYTQWLSQQFTTSMDQTDMGFVQLQINAVGGSAITNTIPDLVTYLYSDSFGTPTTALASVNSSEIYIYGQSFWATIPLAASGLTPSTPYHIVTKIVGSPTHYYAWQHDNTAGGAASSPDGFVWTAKTFGLLYKVFNQSGGGGSSPKIINEDLGARITSIDYAPNTGLPVALNTSTTSTNGSVAYTASITYNNGLITGVG